MSIVKPSGNLFKHDHVFSGYCGSAPYLYYKNDNVIVDGIDRGHVRLYGRCDTCNEEILVAHIHTDKNGKLYSDKKEKQ